MTDPNVPTISPAMHKIRPRHLDRLAIVYVRQSTPHQVANNRESTDLQYQLRRRAVGLGWTDDRVVVIDDDQGISGQSVENRPGFQRLLAEVSLGHVGIALDPDEQVRSVVALVFTKFAELGSLTKTHAFFVTHGIRLGVRVYKGADKGQLVWQRPRRSTLYEMLRHPFYAGAYAYGRCPVDPTRRAAGKKSGRRNAPPEEWVCLLRDKVPAYISWDQHEENRRRLAANDRGRGSKA